MKYYLVLLFFIGSACKAQSVTEKVTFSSLPVSTQNYDSARLIGIEKIGNLWQNKLFFGYQFGAKTVVATVAGLRSTTSVRQDGFYILPDGSIWIWNPSDVSADDGCVTVKATSISTGRFNRSIQDKYVHLKWYAVADTTNQSIAVQKMYDACARLGKTAYHDASMGIIKAKNLLPKCSIEFEEGAWLKIDQSASVPNHDALMIMSDVKDKKYINICIDGNKAGLAGNEDYYVSMIRVTTSNQISNREFGMNKNLLFDGGILKNGWGGISIFSSRDVTIRNAIDSNIDGHVIAFGTCENIYIENVHAYGGTSEKFSAWGQDSINRVKNFNVTNCWINGSDYGIDMRYVDGFNITGNHLMDIKHNAIYSSNSGVVGTITNWKSGCYNGVISNNDIRRSVSGITGMFSYTKFVNNIIDSTTSNGFLIGSATSFRTYGNSFVNNTVKNTGAGNDAMKIANNSDAIIYLNIVTDDRTVKTINQAISIDSCFGTRVYGNIFKGMLLRNINLNRSDSTIIDDDNITGQVLINGNNTNTFVKSVRNVFNASPTTILNVINNNNPTGIAAIGSTWRNVNASVGGIFYVNETGTTTWAQTGASRMTTAQRVAISSPADGLSIYDTDLHKLFINENGTWVQK